MDERFEKKITALIGKTNELADGFIKKTKQRSANWRFQNKYGKDGL